MKSVRKLASKTASSFRGSININRSKEFQNNVRRNASSPPALDRCNSSKDDHYTYDNGTVVKNDCDNVEMEQAVQSLQSALELIKKATDNKGTWVNAKDLLDETAAALDDAGLALRRSPSNNANKRKSSIPPAEAHILKLADKVIERRRRFLGGSSVHDVDGVWTKSVYGDCNGISFGTDHEELCRVPDKDKDEKALILYAGQTGTSKMLAKSLHRSLGGDARSVLRNMKNTAIKDLLAHKRVYIICSTFGLGRPPRDGELFYSNVQLEAIKCKENLEDLAIGEEEEKALAGTSVAIAALGSSAFDHYATFGLDLTDELVTLGASTALGTITIDGVNGKTEQKQIFEQWENKIIQMENERLMFQKEMSSTKQKRRSSHSKIIPATCA